MKFLILALCVACASAASIEQAAQIIRSEYNLSPEGEFQYVYETDNGISGQASGAVKQISKDEIAVVHTGSNQFKSPEGETFQITYIADENGYQPQGAHLPTPPPNPEYVVRALNYIAAHPPVESKRL